MVEVLITLAAAIAGLAFVLALWRFVRGPSRVDRVVAFDVLTVISITFIVLAGMGVATQRMETVGYGEEFPVAANGTDTDRALNRRVEVYIAESDQPVRARR